MRDRTSISEAVTRLRARLHPELSNQKRRTIRDVISVPLSILAFLLSVTTTYITVIKQTDDVRAIIGDGPYIFVDGEGRTGVIGRQQMTVVNAGNRSAAVIGVSLVIIKRAEPLASFSDCAAGNSLTMVYKIDGIVTRHPRLSRPSSMGGT